MSNSFNKVIDSLNKSVFSKPNDRVIFDVSEKLDTFIQGDAHSITFIEEYSLLYEEAFKAKEKILVLDFSSVMNVGHVFLNDTLTTLIKQRLISSSLLDDKIFIKGSKLFINTFKSTLDNLENNKPVIKNTKNLQTLLQSKATYERYKTLLENSGRADRNSELKSVLESLAIIDSQLESIHGV